MGSSPKQMSARQIERLKSELAEIILTHFCYPPFLDYRLDMLRTRPVDRRKRQEIWAYINNIKFGALSSEDSTTTEFRRFVERILLRAIEMNRGLIGALSPRRVTIARSQVPQLAGDVVRGLADYLTLGEASAFGQARAVESWAMVQGHPEPTWEQIERSTQLLQTTLVYLHSAAPKASEQRAGARAGDPPPRESARQLHEEEVLSVISAFPTMLLVPAHEEPTPVAGGTNGGAPPAQPGLHDLGPLYETAPLDFPPGQKPASKRQFLAPGRSRSVSRPVNDPLALSSLAADDLGQMTGSPLEPPPPLVEPPPPTPTPPPAQSPPPAPAPVPSAADLAPAPRLTPAQNDWLAMLLPEGQVEPPTPSPATADGEPKIAEVAEPPVRAAASPDVEMVAELLPAAEVQLLPEEEEVQPLPAEVAASPVGPFGVDLPALPESFPTSPALNLPPDLAELYGDYLRDTRSGAFQADSQEGQPVALVSEVQTEPPPAPLPAEAEEEIDALFNALTNHISEEEPEWLAQAADHPPSALDTASSAAAQPPTAEQPITDRPTLPPLTVQPANEPPARPPAITTPLEPWPVPPAPPEPLDVASAAPEPPNEIRDQPLPEQPAPPAQSAPMSAPKEMSDADLMIFAQLQHQVATWVKIAAVSHQLEISGYDAAGLVGELRRAAALDEAELQVIESLVALCQRVTSTRQATLDDYKQAMMLYLLHHRSRLAL